MNPVDAEARGIQRRRRRCLIRNDRGACKMTASSSPRASHPGAVATAERLDARATSIEGNYQMLTHLTLNPTEEFIGADQHGVL